MLLSVLIPALNEAESIGACLESVAAVSWPGEVETLVAPGGSEDDTAAIARRHGARIASSPTGRGVQLTAAAEQARGEVLLILHADNRLTPDVGTQLGEAMQATEIAWGAFRQRIEAPGLGYRLLERGNAFRARWLRLPYGDQAMFFRRDALDAVGGTPRLPLMEDVALSQRLAKRFGAPSLLPGPVLVSARRWRRTGVVRQTLRNWLLLAAFRAGVPVEWIARRYQPHQPTGEQPS